MSQATDVAVEDSEYEDVTEWATAAVRGANNWLVTIRNATDEGINEWSDEFTNGRNGIVSYAEAVTALSLTKQHAPVDHPDWQTLRDRYLQDDLGFILEQITAEDGPKFKPDPYLGGKDDESLDTTSFVPAATFSASSILESLVAGVDFGADIDDSEIEEALDTCLDWLLSNRVQDGDELETTDGAGWAWVGKTSEKYTDLVRPANYYTYSAVIVLCDFLQYREDHRLIDRVVSNYESELMTAISEANSFLLNEYWDDECWTVPTGVTEKADDIEKLLSTCYAFIGLSYIEYARDDIDMGGDQKAQMGTAMNWALNFYEDDPYVWGKTVEYDCGPEEDDPTFTDGSAPYVLLDSMVELINFRTDIIGDVNDYSESAIRAKAREELAPTILDKCWAGNKKFEDKGFRHVANGDLLLQRADGAPGTNMTAIYSTGVAIETFLLNFLTQGEDIEEGTQRGAETTESSAESTEADDSTESVGQVEKKTVNNIILDGDGGGYPDDLGEELQSIKSEVSKLSDELKDADAEDVTDSVDEDTLAFLDKLGECSFVLMNEYSETVDWTEDVCDDMGKARERIAQTLQQNWDTKFKRKNTELMVQFLGKLYFCPSKEAYEDQVKLKDDYIMLLPPQRAIHDEVAAWDDDDFADTEARREYAEASLQRLIDEPWGGEDVSDAVHSFEKRFKEEVLD